MYFDGAKLLNTHNSSTNICHVTNSTKLKKVQYSCYSRDIIIFREVVI